jgi:hypothetical protein
MIFNPHKLGIHKVLKYVPLNAVFDAPYKAAVKKAVNIADLRAIAKSRAHKVSFINDLTTPMTVSNRDDSNSFFNLLFLLLQNVDGF